MIVAENVLDLDNSPLLIKCKGCVNNIGKKDSEVCLIYIENEDS